MPIHTPLTLQLTLDEVNTLLSALGDRPFIQVHQLIRKIQQQAAPQVEGEDRKQIEESAP